MTLKLCHKYISKNIFKIKRLNGNVYTLCQTVWSLTLTYVYFSVKFQYILFELKIVSSFLCIKTKSLWSKFQEVLNSEIVLPQNTQQSTCSGFPDNKESFEMISHLHLIFMYCLYKSRDTRKWRVEELKKNIIKFYNIDKQICFNDAKKKQSLR